LKLLAVITKNLTYRLQYINLFGIDSACVQAEKIAGIAGLIVLLWFKNYF
jgi:hypothetical protein